MIWEIKKRKHAVKDDPNYLYYLTNRKRGFTAIDCLPEGTRDVVYSILEPNPRQRTSADMILKSNWLQSVFGMTCGCN